MVVLFLGGGVSELFGGAAKPLSRQPLTPPVPGGMPYPTSLEDCEYGGWLAFPQFADEEACRDFVDGLTP